MVHLCVVLLVLASGVLLGGCQEAPRTTVRCAYNEPPVHGEICPPPDWTGYAIVEHTYDRIPFPLRDGCWRADRWMSGAVIVKCYEKRAAPGGSQQ